MEAMTTITAAQLRAAVNAWEVDVRADRDAFVQDSEARALPLDEQVDGVVATIFEYAAGFKADGSPLGGWHRGHCAPRFVPSAQVLKVFAPCSHPHKKAVESEHVCGSRAFPAVRTPVCTGVRILFALARSRCLLKRNACAGLRRLAPLQSRLKLGCEQETWRCSHHGKSGKGPFDSRVRPPRGLFRHAGAAGNHAGQAEGEEGWNA